MTLMSYDEREEIEKNEKDFRISGLTKENG